MKETFKLDFFIVNMKDSDQINKFIYGIYKSKAVITDSFHASIFSIIFNKPFIAFINQINDDGRFNTLKKIFKLDDRILNINDTAKISLLETPLEINKNVLNSLKRKSINFLKRNLNTFSFYNFFFRYRANS